MCFASDGLMTEDRAQGESRWRGRAVAVLQRAASAHGRAAFNHEAAYRIHAEAARFFGEQVRFGDAAKERRLAVTHLKAASAERQRAADDWAAAQLAGERARWPHDDDGDASGDGNGAGTEARDRDKVVS